MADTRSSNPHKEANVSKTEKVEQFRFTTWVNQTNPEAAIKEVLRGVPDVELVSLTERRGEYHATIVASSIPTEVRTWFEHFKKKGIPAAIVKQTRSNAYAVFRNGKEQGQTTPETFQPDEFSIVEKTPDFVWTGPRAYLTKKVYGKNAPTSEAGDLQPPRETVPMKV
jgi:hypothetical protein